ncbi:MAG: S-layer homology domain-containing protein [Defluviitaleaceae bacterium]|nr:S-layer homology domain-containing protein [Defluviitaleaceae bacterium]
MRKTTRVWRRVLAVFVAFCATIQFGSVLALGDFGFAPAAVEVTDQEGLIAALQAGEAVIDIREDFDITRGIFIEHPVTINGNGHTLTLFVGSSPFTAIADINLYHLFLVSANTHSTGIDLLFDGSLYMRGGGITGFTASAIRLLGSSNSTTPHPSPFVDMTRGMARIVLYDVSIVGNSSPIGGAILADVFYGQQGHIHIINSEIAGNVSDYGPSHGIAVPFGRISVGHVGDLGDDVFAFTHANLKVVTVGSGSVFAAGWGSVANPAYFEVVPSYIVRNVVATPYIGHVLESLEIKVNGVVQNELVLGSGDEALITAVFAQGFADANLNVAAGQGSIVLGEVLSQVNAGTATGNVPAGLHTFAIIPAAGWQLQSWAITHDGVALDSIPANVTLTPNGTFDVTATFTEIPPPPPEHSAVSLQVVSGQGSIALGNALAQVNVGTATANVAVGSHTLSITPAAGWQLQSWSIVHNGANLTNMPSNITLTAGGALNVTATFAQIQQPPDPDPPAPPPGGGGFVPAPQPPQQAPPTPTEPEPTPPEQAPPAPEREICAHMLFDDVAYGTWYHPYVTIVALEGLFHGTAYRIFEPHIPMSRAMFVQVLANHQGVNLAAYAGTNPVFSDVAAGAWYFAPVQWAYANNIVSGMGDGTFAPNQPITREQMAVLIDLYASHLEISLPVNYMRHFVDQHLISYWAAPSVGIVQAAGIVRGRPDETFDPQGLATRAEVATVFSHFLRIIENQ